MRFFFLLFVLLILGSCSSSRNKTRLSKECSHNNIQACFDLGLKEFDEGEKELASAYFEKGCRLGHNKSCDYFLTGNLKKSRIRDSVKYYERECRSANVYTCTVLGRIYYNLGNEDKGDLFYKRACENGDPPACAFLGHQMFKKEVPEEEMKYFERACVLETETRRERKKTPLYCLAAGNSFARHDKPNIAGKYYEMACKYSYSDDETELYKKLACSRSGFYQENPDHLTMGVGYLQSKCLSQDQKDRFKDCYDLAALYSLQKKPGMALKFFEMSLKLGNNQWKHFFDDHELKFLRSVPLFRPMVYKYYRDYRASQEKLPRTFKK